MIVVHSQDRQIHQILEGRSQISYRIIAYIQMNQFP